VFPVRFAAPFNSFESAGFGFARRYMESTHSGRMTGDAEVIPETRFARYFRLADHPGTGSVIGDKRFYAFTRT
jgi:hypothetical protein